MRPIFHPRLVNGPWGDPLLYVEFLFERRALLFDLGEIGALANRSLLRISDIFISHAHMDHFIGFDTLLRVCLGRGQRIRLFGPVGLIDKVEHKLAAYSWNLVENYESDFTLVVTEVWDPCSGKTAEFHVKQAFRREAERPVSLRAGLLLEEEAFTVRCTILDHQIPCLAFALQERRHVNVWKNRLTALDLPVGPWLGTLKAAILRGESDGFPIRVRWREKGDERERVVMLGELRDAVRVTAGQKIAYVTDVKDCAENRRRIVALARDADLLFIEAVFLERDRRLARQRRHLTAAQAGAIGRTAGARQIVPLHFSARYQGSDAFSLLDEEIRRAFAGAD